MEGSVRVPGEAGNGLAKVTIQIPAWKETPLAPASFAVSLDLDSSEMQTAKPWKEKQP